MLQPEEDSLLEPGFSDDVRDLFVSFKQAVSLAEGKPQHVGSPKLSFPAALDHTIQEVVLGLAPLDEVSPPAQIVPHGVLSPAHDKALQLLGTLSLRARALALLHECLSPQVEELLRAFESNAAIDELVTLARLVHAVEGIAVPQAQVAAL